MKQSDERIIKISAILLITIILIQLMMNLDVFCKKYTNLQNTEKINDFSTIVSALLHKTQQERGAAAGYLGSNTKEFKTIFLKKIKGTNQAIIAYQNFLMHNKVNLKAFQLTIKEISYFLANLPRIRKAVLNSKISLLKEISFYSTMNSRLIHILELLVKGSSNIKLTRSLISYVNFEKAKENMGIERAILSAVFAKNHWTKKLYIEYIQILIKQKMFLHQAMVMSNKRIKKLYQEIMDKKILKQVHRLEQVALLKNKNFNINPVKTYQLITEKLNLMQKIDKCLYEHNFKMIQKIKDNLIFDIFKNLFISLLVFIFVIYNLYILNKENKLLKEKVIYDQLTKLYNRLFFISEFEIFKNKAIRKHTKIGILFIDLDGFKDINDSLGHDAGDKILIEVAKRIKKVLRQDDIVARFGGDEFLIMLDELKDIKSIKMITNKLLYELKKPIKIKNIENRVTASIGVSIYPDNGQDIHTLIKYADTSMYKSKQAGKNRVTIYENKMGTEVDTKLKLKSDIYRAIDNNEFELFYQPQIDNHNKLVGMETLIRWNHPELGVVSPFYFIPIAIEIGFIEEIDLWVMKTAMKQIKEWTNKGYDVGVVSCNLTVYQLEKGNFLENFKAILNEIDIDPTNFGLEVTEEGIMKNPEKNINILQKLKEMKITLSIDDFGTGYSSFAYLKKLPIDKLKVDRTFIKDIPQNEDDKVITASIITLAKQLNLKTIAEGVETEAQRDFVFSKGCDIIQGYFYSPPIAKDDFERVFLKKEI